MKRTKLCAIIAIFVIFFLCSPGALASEAGAQEQYDCAHVQQDADSLDTGEEQSENDAADWEVQSNPSEEAYSSLTVEGEAQEEEPLPTDEMLMPVEEASSEAESFTPEEGVIQEGNEPGLAPMDAVLNTDNQWDVLALIFREVNTSEFHNSFSDKEMNKIKYVLSEFPDTMRRLSGERIIFRSMQVEIVDQPIRSVSGYEGSLSYGESGDVNLDSYLSGHDYNQIIAVAPLSGHPKNTINWYGLGGSYYDYQGRRIFNLIVNNIPLNSRNGSTIDGEEYNRECAPFIHEMLHCIETNSKLRGKTDFQELHSAEANGYEAGNDEWLSWYHDLMQDKIKTHKQGFSPEAFLTDHTQETPLKTRTFLVVLDPCDGESKPLQRTFVSGLPYSHFPVPHRKGYTFLGWHDKKNGGNLVSPEDTADPGKTALYAHWSAEQVGTDGYLSLSPHAWEMTYNWNAASSSSIQGDSVVIDNLRDNHCALTQSVAVKAHTQYELSADVRVEGFASTDRGGATIGWGSPTEESCVDSEFVTSSQWKKVSIIFDSEDCTKITLHLANGGFGAVSRGSAFFKNVTLTEQKKEQKISVKKEFRKEMGSSAFQLGAKSSGDGKLSYHSSNEKVAEVDSKGKVTIRGVGYATITVEAAETASYLPQTKGVAITVVLKKTDLSSAKYDKKKKVVNVVWEKNTTGKGYEVQYSTDKKYKKGVKTVKISKNKTVKTTVKMLKSGKTYYFRIRTVNGKNHSKWSSNKSVKVQ